MLANTGPFDEFELAPAADAGFLDDVRAGDVGGHQVGRELDAVERQVESLGDRGNQQGFRQSGHSHQQRVAAGEKADRELFDDQLLADDGFAEFRAEGLVGFSEFIDGGDVIGRKLMAQVVLGIPWVQCKWVKTRSRLGFVQKGSRPIRLHSNDAARFEKFKVPHAGKSPQDARKISIYRLPAPGGLLNHPPRGAARESGHPLVVTRNHAHHGTYPRH